MFVKGQPGGPGRPKDPGSTLLIKHTRHNILQRISEFLDSDFTRMQEVLTDPQAKSLDKLICSIIVHAVKTGDERKFAFLLGYTIGKPKEFEEEKTEVDRTKILDLVPREKLKALVGGNSD